jgi:hypothetical protein
MKGEIKNMIMNQRATASKKIALMKKMADKKVTALTDIGTGIAASDVWMVIQTPGGTPVNKKMTVSNFTGYFPSFLVDWCTAWCLYHHPHITCCYTGTYVC